MIAVDESEIHEWTTLINPGTRSAGRSRRFNGVADDAVAQAPCFGDIAADLGARLAGRLFIAHNARFDFGFLRAEFLRAGIGFQPQVLCSAMLSRKLYPALEDHDLDTLMQRHGLHAEVLIARCPMRGSCGSSGRWCGRNILPIACPTPSKNCSPVRCCPRTSIQG